MLGVLGRAIYWTLGAVQTVGELVGSGARLVRQMRKGKVPIVSLDDTDPIPLTHRDAERIAEFGRNAGHERAKPPPLKR
jgi:hypothetical protein